MSKSQRLVSKRFDQIGELYSGATPSTAKSEYWEGDIVWITPNDLSRLRTPFLESSQKMLTAKGLRSCSAYILPAGSVVISSRAPIGYLAVSKVDYCTNQGCKSILLKEGYDPLYIYYNILHNIDKVKRIGEGTTFAEISKSALANIEFDYIVNTKAQSKIAEILSTVDKAIEQTEAIITKQQRIKTGLMQDLLTKGIDENGNIRSEETHEFKDSPLGRIPVAWDVDPAVKLCDAVIDCKNRTPPETQEGHPVIRTPNVRDGEFKYEELLFTDHFSYNIWTARGKPRPGDVVITREAPFGEACLIPEDIPEACLGQRMMMYQTNPDLLCSEYLVYIICSERVQAHLLELAGGSTVGHIRVGDIRNLLIPHPKDTKEQRRISGILRAASKSIDDYVNQLSKFQSLKIALMQDLLTGDVPVANLLDEQSAI